MECTASCVVSLWAFCQVEGVSNDAAPIEGGAVSPFKVLQMQQPERGNFPCGTGRHACRDRYTVPVGPEHADDPPDQPEYATRISSAPWILTGSIGLICQAIDFSRFR